MANSYRSGRPQSRLLRVALAAALCALGSSAQAQITRGFIGPHEYALPDPVGMKPWNVFVEYVTLQKTDQVWNTSRDKVDVGKTEALIGLSKFVHFWTPQFAPNMGIGWEIIVPTVGIRDKVNGTSSSGIGDPITGPALWIKPNANWTLGLDFFIQVPVGDSDIGGGDRWNVIGSFFWDGQFDKINYTANLGYNIPGKSSAGIKPGVSWYTNHRLGYKVSDLIEPYLGVDYERQESKAGVNPSNHEWAGSLGVMFHMFPNSHLAVHYSRGFRGESRAVSDNFNLRWAYAF
jgi:hypothetical protein